MNVSLVQLRAFCALARLRSFGAAAAEIGLSQSALSLRIQQLEASLETRLFERSTRQVRLTDPGAQLLPRARHLLNDLDLMLRDVRDAGAGRRKKVTIAGIPSYTSTKLPPILARFQSLYPEIDIEAVDVNAEQVYEYVRSGHAHFGITMPGMAPERDMSYTFLFYDGYRMVCSVGHRLAEYESVTWQMLEGEPFILMSPVTSVRRVLDIEVPEEIARLDVRFEVWNLPTVFGFVREGLGITVLPELALASGRIESLSTRQVTQPHVRREVGLIQKIDRKLPDEVLELRARIIQQAD